MRSTVQRWLAACRQVATDPLHGFLAETAALLRHLHYSRSMNLGKSCEMTGACDRFGNYLKPRKELRVGFGNRDARAIRCREKHHGSGVEEGDLIGALAHVPDSDPRLALAAFSPRMPAIGEDPQDERDDAARDL